MLKWTLKSSQQWRLLVLVCFQSHANITQWALGFDWVMAPACHFKSSSFSKRIATFGPERFPSSSIIVCYSYWWKRNYGPSFPCDLFAALLTLKCSHWRHIQVSKVMATANNVIVMRKHRDLTRQRAQTSSCLFFSSNSWQWSSHWKRTQPQHTVELMECDSFYLYDKYMII